jgi:hypothetical protein
MWHRLSVPGALRVAGVVILLSMASPPTARSSSVSPLSSPAPGRLGPALPQPAPARLPGEASPPAEPAPSSSRLSYHLRQLAAAERHSSGAGKALAAGDLRAVPAPLASLAASGLMQLDTSGRVQVYVAAIGSARDAATAVRAVGGDVEHVREDLRLVQAWVAVSALEGLGLSPGVDHVRLPDYGIPGTGSATTQGDAILKADQVRSQFHVDGTGVRVGIISSGIGGLAAAVASGNLPPNVDTTTCNVTSADPGASGAEATAMLEIVHHLAPGARLYNGNFSHGSVGLGTSLEFDAAVNCLAQHADVVVDDLQWLNIGPYDGTSQVSQNTASALNKAVNPIRAYTTIVGNFAQQHYRDQFHDSGVTLKSQDGTVTWHLHEFQANSETVTAGQSVPCAPGTTAVCGNRIFLAKNGGVRLFLEWDEPFNAAINDYDLFLFDDTAGKYVATSEDLQSVTHQPTEFLSWTNSHDAGFFEIMIGWRSGAMSSTFQMFAFCDGCQGLPNGNRFDFDTPTRSVCNQGDAGGGVISAGALDALSSGAATRELFSGQGPTEDDRVKPDIMGVDDVSVSGAGGFATPFFGTSAAAPHIGGILALLLQLKPSLLAGSPGDDPAADRTTLSNALLSTATDLGPPGVDNAFGAGRADALAAADALVTTVGPCVEDAQTTCLVNGRFEVKLNWQTASGTGPGQVMSFGGQRAESDESAFFWFFSPSNFELGLKILDACAVNQKFWVFISGLTNQGWTAHLRDSQTGVTRTYSNALNNLTKTTADTAALSCP